VKVGPSNVIRTSIDGVAWTKRRACIPASLYAVAYGNSLFVAVGNEGAVVTSADGIEWTSQDSGTEERLRGIAYGEGIFVAVGYSGTIISSKDGVRWTSRKSGTGNRLQSIAYGNGTFVAVGWNGVILTSRSGHTWIRRNSGTSSHLWSVAYTEGDLVLPTLGGCMPTGSQRAGRRMNEPFLSSTHTLRIPSLQKKRRGGERLAKILRTTLYMINTSLIGTEAVSVIPPDLMQGVAKRDCHSPPNYLQVSSVPGFFVCLHGWLGVSPAQIRNRLIKT
jgi:hypothetical protein